MDNRTNTIAGWVLAACGAALGLSIVGGMVYKPGHLEKPGFPIEGGEPEPGAGPAAAVPIATLMASADPAKGADVFKKCSACHTVTQGGANGIGPNLYATMGEGVAEGKAGYVFSDALKSHGGKWDFETMNAWLTSPRAFAAGTKMTFAGLGNDQDRANVIAYINAQGSNLPMPAAPAAQAPTAPAEPGAAVNDTGELANAATLAPGAPSKDPAAAERAPK